MSGRISIPRLPGFQAKSVRGWDEFRRWGVERDDVLRQVIDALNQLNRREVIIRPETPSTKTFVSIPGSGSGDVAGPSSAVDNDVTVFDGTTGKTIRRWAAGADNKVIRGHGTRQIQTAQTTIDDSGNVVLGAAYASLSNLAAPSAPAAGTRLLYVDSSSGELSVRTSAGTTVSLESVSDIATGVDNTLARYNGTTGVQDSGITVDDSDNVTLAAAYVDVPQLATPASPSSGTRRLHLNSTSGRLSVQSSAGNTIPLESTFVNIGAITAAVDVGPSNSAEVDVFNVTMPANMLDTAGSYAVIECLGDYLRDAADRRVQWKLYVGSSNIVTHGVNQALPQSNANEIFRVRAVVTHRGSGNVRGEIWIEYMDINSSPDRVHALAAGNLATSVTTSGALALRLTARWYDSTPLPVSDANNDLDVQQCVAWGYMAAS